MTKTLICRFQKDLASYHARTQTATKTKPYSYLYDGTAEVKKGDFAVIARGEDLSDIDTYGLCQIEEVVDAALPEATKFVITVLDLTEHEKRIEKAKTRSLLIAKLKEMEKQQTELDRFNRLAESNPAAAELLAQLKAL